MDSMDCADASQLTPTRNSSVTALQALSMLNNHFMVRYAEHWATNLEHLHTDSRRQLDWAFQLAYGRRPTQDEIKALSAYGAKHGMANVCRLILNSNEFVFVN
jgi:hypothetical protein